jgi:hypothetical protein
MRKQDALNIVENTLPRIYGLCSHRIEGAIPPAARDCYSCVAEEVVDALERSLGLRWES